MADRRTTSQRLKSIAGASIFAIGLFLLFVNVDGAAAQIGDALGAPAEALGILPALGLAGMHAVQAYAFHRAEFLPGMVQILVSFWPLILILIGAVLLRDVFRGRFAELRAGAGSSTMSESQE